MPSSRRKPMEASYYDEALRLQDPDGRVGFAIQAIPLLDGFRHVLDIGCGSGVLAALVLEAGHEVTALDFSSTACELTAKRALGAKVIQHDLRTGIPFTADAAVMIQVLEHLADDVGALRSALKAAPFVVVSVPRSRASQNPDHLRSYSKGSILERFGALGQLRFHEDDGRTFLFSISRPISNERGQRIRQCYQSHGLNRAFFAAFHQRWGFQPYTDADAPLIVFGCYGERDLKVVRNHRGLLVMLWAGSDILNHGHRPVFKKANVRHIAVSKFIASDLKRFGLRGRRLVLPFVDLTELEPAPLGDAVYVYLPRGGGKKHGRSIVDAVRRRLRQTRFIMNIAADLGPRELRAAYRNSFMSLRLTPHDGMACSVIELGLMGRRSVYNGDYPCAIPWSSVDGIVRTIRAEAKRRGETPEKLAAVQAVSDATRKVIHITDEWLWSDFWAGTP